MEIKSVKDGKILNIHIFFHDNESQSSKAMKNHIFPVLCGVINWSQRASQDSWFTILFLYIVSWHFSVLQNTVMNTVSSFNIVFNTFHNLKLVVKQVSVHYIFILLFLL